MKRFSQKVTGAVWLLAVLAVSGCDKIADGSRAAESVTRNSFEDSISAWTDLFTYHPPRPDALPQTRYCYQLQSDIVCFDSEQRGQTAKLVGYQDGENISWVQPGGGSLGVSGGEAIALRPEPPPRAVRAPVVDAIIKNSQDVSRSVNAAANEIYTGPVSGNASAGSSSISVTDLKPSSVHKDN